MNLPRSVICALVLSSSSLLLTPARATSVIAPEFDSLVNQADYIVRAVVTNITTEWRDNDGHRRIITKVTLDVKEIVAGTPPSPLILEMLGGKIGDQELVVHGAPKFFVGDEDILFIKKNGRSLSPLVGIMHGRYPILRDQKTGKNAMLRSNGIPLYNRSEVSLPLAELPQATQKTPRAIEPLTSADFIAQIRQSRRASN